MNTRSRAASRVSRLARATSSSTPIAPVQLARQRQSPARDRVQARAVRAGRDLDIPADITELLRAGKLEQTCRDCGRCEAAGRTCSWCARRMGPDDWYRNGNADERARRMPDVAPVDPPVEFRRTYRPQYGDGWPPAWGPNPFEEAARARRSRVRAGRTPVVAPVHASDPDAGFWPA